MILVLATLTKAGSDVAALPDDIDGFAGDKQKLSAVMKSFTLALGTTFDGCHAKSGSKIDYGAPASRSCDGAGSSWAGWSILRLLVTLCHPGATEPT